MSRSIGGPLASHLATSTHTIAVMLRLDLLDGTSVGITDHDQVLEFDLGDGAIDFAPDTGILPSAVMLSEGFETDSFEVSGPIGETVTRAAVKGGRFDRATARLFLVNWSSLGSGPVRLLGGQVCEARVAGGTFVLEIRSDSDKLNQPIGRVLTPYCDADFGDARCGYNVVPVAAIVSAIGDKLGFECSFAGSYPDDHFNAGTVTFTTGALAGTRPIEIFDWGSDGTVTLFASLAQQPEIGDELELRIGCLKIRKSDDPTARTCMFYDNIANNRSFPDIPGSDQVLKYQVPTGGD